MGACSANAIADRIHVAGEFASYVSVCRLKCMAIQGGAAGSGDSYGSWCSDGDGDGYP